MKITREEKTKRRKEKKFNHQDTKDTKNTENTERSIGKGTKTQRREDQEKTRKELSHKDTKAPRIQSKTISFSSLCSCVSSGDNACSSIWLC